MTRKLKTGDRRQTKLGLALEQGAKEILAHVKGEARLPVRRIVLPPSAKAPCQRLLSEEAAAQYFETHSVAEVWDQLPEAKPLKLSRALTKAIRKRREVRQA